MIYGKFSYENFEKDFLKEIGDFLKNNDLANFKKGITKIDNDRQKIPRYPCHGKRQ